MRNISYGNFISRVHIAEFVNTIVNFADLI